MSRKFFQFCGMPNSFGPAIGILVAAFPVVKYGKIHYRHLESLKITALKTSAGNFDAFVDLDEQSTLELNWSVENIECSVNNLQLPEVDLIIHTDASYKGWGAYIGLTPTGVRWDESEPDYINIS